MDGSQLVRECSSIGIEHTRAEQRGCYFFFCVVLRTSCGGLGEKQSVILFRLGKQDTIEMLNAEHTFPGSAVTRSGFVTSHSPRVAEHPSTDAILSSDGRYADIWLQPHPADIHKTPSLCRQCLYALHPLARRRSS